ncbi:coatomer subunit beta'-like [Lycodopsis pacificus]
MPLRLDIKRKLTARSDRVKSADLHPTEPWMVASLYSGTVVVWNHETQMMVKTFELCDLPVRVAKFVARKHWVVAGADDMQIRVFNYNTLERVHMFEAHSDYIRCIVVHPTQPYILTSSDDMLIKLWNWDKKWTCSQVFEGHTHYVMQIVINPKDNNQFASASLDRTIKVWQLGSRTPNFTLEGHEKGVNCIDYYSGGDKPYLISGADDRLVKIWDYQNKTCVQTLEGHAQNVTCVCFHPELPIILTGSEDGTVRVWHSNTYRLENTLNYGMERVWCISSQPGSNSVALGYDEGSIIIKMGREEPAMSMDASGKVMWARHSEVQQANLKAMGDAEIRDGERLQLGVKDMGSCEIFPQTIQHSPNGRFVVVCGDGEYIIYTAMALRNKSFGSAQEFVWAHDSSQYAIREGSSRIKIFKNFKEKNAFKPDFGAEGIFGGFLLGVRSNSGLAFYDWESSELIRRIEIQPKHIFWSDSGELVCIGTDESFFVLRYLPERVAAARESKEEITEDGIEGAFEVLGEVPGVVKTGLWVGDCFIYTSSLNRLNYYVGGELITIAHLDRTMYLLGYIPKDDRLYLGDKELNVISYALLLSVLEYQTAVMRRDFGTADKVLPTIPKEQRTRVANFLEKQGFRQQALAVSTDPEHKFELALHLGELKMAHQLALEAESEHKWKQLAELATTKCQFSLAQECLHQAQDYGGLLLLATASGNASMVGKLAEGAERDGKTNVAFLTYFLQGRLDKCLDLLIETGRLPEAAFLARTYLPSHVSRVVKLWKESLSRVNQKAADALADPSQYSNLFPGLQQALLAEGYLKETHVGVRPAAEYPLVMPNEDRNVLEESAGFESTGELTEPEGEVESMTQTVMVAAVTEAAPAETAVVEEPILLQQEIVDPVPATEEEAIPAAAAAPLPVTVTEEHVEPEQASSEDDAVAKSEEALISVEDDVLESTTEIPPAEPEMVRSSPVEDVRSPVETDVQEISPATDPAACESETHLTITATEETPSATIATESVPVSAGLMVDTDVTESIAPEGMPVYEEQETGAISSEAPAEETGVTDTAALPVAVEELISFESTDSPPLDEPVQSQTLPDLDPLRDTMPALKPKQAEQSTALPVEPEENLEPAEDLDAELDQILDDLDNFDLEDIDTSDVNLDDDCLSE